MAQLTLWSCYILLLLLKGERELKGASRFPLYNLPCNLISKSNYFLDVFIILQNTFSSKCNRSLQLNVYKNGKCSFFRQNLISSGHCLGVAVHRMGHRNSQSLNWNRDFSGLILGYPNELQRYHLQAGIRCWSLSSLHALAQVIFTNPSKYVTIILPILQMRQSRHREMSYLHKFTQLG